VLNAGDVLTSTWTRAVVLNGIVSRRGAVTSTPTVVEPFPGSNEIHFQTGDGPAPGIVTVTYQSTWI